LINLRRARLLIVVVIAAACAGWLYWNRPVYSDMSAYAPGDSLAFVEANDLTEVIKGIEQTQAWTSLAAPIGAPSRLLPNRWLISLARWTGIGSADAILFARSQLALVLTGAEASQAGETLTVKPLTTLVIETHTTQRRMRAAVERHVEDLARRVYKDPVFARKQLDGIELKEWTSSDGSHRIVTAFVDTTAIVGNDEQAVLRCIEVRIGKRPALLGARELVDLREKVAARDASVFGFVSKSGVKSLLQAFALSRATSSSDAVIVARIFADTLGSLVNGLGWSSRFVDGMVEDRCAVDLSEGTAEKLRAIMSPDSGIDLGNLAFVPADAHSFSVYHLRDPEGFWRDLNAVVASHSDLVGAIAARPMLRSLFKPYGIEDPETFARAVGPRIQTIRLDENSPSVLIAEAFDRQALREVVNQRLGQNPKIEKVGDVDLLLSSSDNWSAAFADKYFLIGPADSVRSCLLAKSQSQSLSSAEPFRKSQRLLDVSLPITSVTFTRDQHAAISFVEIFSPQERSAFATNGGAIDEAIRVLPYAASVTILKGSELEWTSRSSFGLVGSLAADFAPQRSQ